MSGETCKTSNDCENGAVCTMTYADEDKLQPLGRFCKGGDNPMGDIVTCMVDSDCPIGNCEVIRDVNGNFSGRQCVKNGETVRENSYDNPNKNYGKYFYNRSVEISKIVSSPFYTKEKAKKLVTLANKGANTFKK